MKRRLISGNLYNTVPKLVKLVSPLGIQQNYIIEKKYKQLSCRKVHLLTSCNCHCTEGGQHSINAADERTAAQD